MCAVKEDMGAPYIVDGPDFPAFIAQFDPAKTTTVTYNALFDNSILAWRYGFVPNRMLDAMGMARALRGHKLPGASLEVVARTLELGEKGKTLLKVKGMNRAQIIAAGLWPEFKDYALQDVDLCAKIFFHLYHEFPAEERRFMDLVLRCTIRAALHSRYQTVHGTSGRSAGGKGSTLDRNRCGGVRSYVHQPLQANAGRFRRGNPVQNDADWTDGSGVCQDGRLHGGTGSPR